MNIEPKSGERPSQLFRVDEELSRVLSSSQFQGSKKCQALLKYLVENSMGGDDSDGMLKERTIGIEVFGRTPDYNTADDATVRVRVGEVRRRLAEYYQSPEAQGSAVQIVIPHGSYRPTFALHPTPEVESRNGPVMVLPQAPALHDAEGHPEPEPPASSVPRSQRTVRWRVWGIAAAVTCAVALAAWIATSNWRKSEFDLFWGPILDSKKPVIIYTGTIPTYLYSTSAATRIVSQQAGGHEQPAEMISLPPLAEGEVLTANDVVVVPDMASSEDIAANVMAAQMLGAHSLSVEFHAGPDLSFVGASNSPMVLIGAMSNQLTLYTARDLPYYFDHDWKIRERGGQGRTWYTSGVITHVAGIDPPSVQPADKARLAHATVSAQPVNQNGSAVLEPDSKLTEDYAIVSRLLDSKTGGPVIVIAGIHACGNQAAAEFLTDPTLMRKLSSIPRDALEHKNLELVLHTSLLNGSPASVEIKATHYW